jgi:hypothetical protein
MKDNVFCWTSNEPLAPGERLHFEVLAPVSEAGGRGNCLLKGYLKVLRVELKGLGPGFEITARIEMSENAAN